MTLLAYNGFEGYTDPYDQRDAGDFISSINRNNVGYSTGRNGGKSLIYNNDVPWNCIINMSIPSIENTKVGIVGFAIKIANFSDMLIMKFVESANSNGFQLYIDSAGNLQFRAVAATIRDFANYSININTWYYIEAKVRVHDTLGVCIARINEQEVLNYSGDLKNLGGNFINELEFQFPIYSSMEIDDIYIGDDQGTENNDFLGDIRIDTIHPSGAGNYAQMTPSVGNNYECVDETEMDDSDYVEGANVAEKDSYAYDDVPTDLDDAAIIALQTKNNCQRTGTASNIKIDNFIRTGAADYSQTAQDLPDAIGMIDGDIIIEDPSDSNIWTQAKINACEFGMEVGS